MSLLFGGSESKTGFSGDPELPWTERTGSPVTEPRAEGEKPFLHSSNSQRALAFISAGDRKSLECGVTRAGANPHPEMWASHSTSQSFI